MGMHSGKYKTFNIHEKTSDKVFDKLNEEFNFTFDPCPLHSKINGLEINWIGNVFINPPYGKEIKKWLEKAMQELQKNCNLCVFLLPAYPDVKWFHEIVLEKANEIRFIKGRLKFGDHKQTAPFASMIVIFNKL
jgi:hypothetical protein